MKIDPVPASFSKAVGASQPQGHENPKLWELSKNFESIFAKQMVDAMRKTVVRDGVIPQSHAEKVYQSMLDSKYSEKMAGNGQLGLANIVYSHLLRSMTQR